ncbi:hypothetical protein M5K25_016456 [Dendrobium thyrsiflorum]|uniref:Uncharacterized protein n=1 Tax=Dendrobium thyrsiflorum TaxID=117978 RepID=A0ABD0URN8_DENTH
MPLKESTVTKRWAVSPSRHLESESYSMNMISIYFFIQLMCHINYNRIVQHKLSYIYEVNNLLPILFFFFQLDFNSRKVHLLEYFLACATLGKLSTAIVFNYTINMKRGKKERKEMIITFNISTASKYMQEKMMIALIQKFGGH